MHWLWTSFTALPWWAMILWVAYTIYFLIRAYYVWEQTSEYGFKKGYKNVFIGNSKHLRLYHLVRMLLDVPPSIIGLFFPLLKAILKLKIYTFNEKNGAK